MNLNTGGWASPLLRLVARLRSDGVNSTTPVTEINGGTISATNADIALVAKGTGATLAQVPDGTIAGGNKRGIYATDWQKNRSVSLDVASGVESVIGGGQQNRATSDQSTVSGGLGNQATNLRATIAGGMINTASGQYSSALSGYSNTASTAYSFVGGGQSNTAQTNTHATVCGGNGNTASGTYSFVGGGIFNTASSAGASVLGGSVNTASGGYSVVCGGLDNTASGTATFVAGGRNTASGGYSVVCGGLDNTASGAASFVAGGRRGTSRGITGNHVFPSGGIPIADVSGVSQSALLILARQTTDATATVLTSNISAASTTNQVILPNNSAYSFSGEVIAGVTGGGNTARWTIDGAIKRGATAASTTMVGTPTVTMTHNDAGAAAWIVAVTADTTNGGISVTVTGAAATTIRWVARITTTEMTY